MTNHLFPTAQERSVMNSSTTASLCRMVPATSRAPTSAGRW